MTNNKTTQCVNCNSLFSNEELIGKMCCPQCGTKKLPIDINNNISITINHHYLRILCIWAENWAAKVDNDNLDNPAHESLKDTVYKITKNLKTQINNNEISTATKLPPLTLFDEIKQLQEERGVNAKLFRDGVEEDI